MPSMAANSLTKSATAFNWKIAGQAGEGVMVSAKLLAKAVMRHGWQAFNYLEYPSLIKGGHQTGQVYAAAKQAYCQYRRLDLLIIFHQQGFVEHQDEIDARTIVFYNSDLIDESILKKYPQFKAKLYPLPFFSLAKQAASQQIAANVVALGASAYVLGLKRKVLSKLIKEEFQAKGQKIIKANLAALQIGHDAAAAQLSPLFKVTSKQTKQLLLNGNEAVALGAIAAGVQYFSGYPMTPTSSLMHYLAAAQQHYPLVVKHTEDEIAGINQALGAAYAGVRAMTATSGGGFALMVEGLSLAGVTELPIVIAYGMRQGPATGLPTWTSQADLQFVLRAGHGEFQRVVLTPGTIQEHFELTQQAFVLAEKFQIPVFILSDKYALESHQTMAQPQLSYALKRYAMVKEQDLPKDDSYRRYKLTRSGVSPRSVPGQAHGLQVTNSYDHDEFGFATEDAQLTKQQIDKRQRKLKGIAQAIPQPVLLGPKKAPVTLVSWGSTTNVILELLTKTKKVNAIHLPCVWPFPSKQFQQLAQKAQKLVMIEGNATGQAQQLIRQQTGLVIKDSVRRYDGRPFYVNDLIKELKLK
ncbi:MAG: 2-oxoacid:acceptor oxidoreductase subunit alpha [Candidatus Pacebacteria bacterium]|nr:2-oxoacid:acceptor oxidoreductase subunit alpha [Candidatus Paceibacterota bacterium]